MLAPLGPFETMVDALTGGASTQKVRPGADLGCVAHASGRDIATRFVDLMRKTAPAISHRRLLFTEARRLESEARRLSRPRKEASHWDAARAEQLRVAALAIRHVATQTD